ncbi:MAG TPA: hypothetical protein VHG10_00685 [Glycomyces sp.]|nr:hypothetical protein [Glycomyces sp.]
MSETTEAERAAAAELTNPECPWHETCTGSCDAARSHARAVVDAVRGPMYRELAGRVEAGIDDAAKDRALEIWAMALKAAADAWADGAHDQQGTSPELWLRDRAEAIRTKPEES